ncbi:hypothetical protein A6V29_07615 [Blastococcus sp. CCUG 61487]|nr:hypothetical protein A6V29_07615 [Blastococcus sp. CCUG 61487]
MAFARELGRSFRYDQPVWLQTDVLTSLVRIALGRTPDGDELLARLLGGNDVLCLAITEPEVGSRLDALACRLTEEPEGARLHGCKSAVSLGTLADCALVVARDAAGQLVLAEIRSKAAGVTVDPLACSPGYPSLAALTMEAAQTRVLSRGGTTLLALHRALSVERTFLALMLLESADEMLIQAAGRVRAAAPEARGVARATIARMRAREAGARALVDRLAEAYVAGQSPGISDGASARWLSADLAMDAARYLVEVCGTTGLLHGAAPRPLDRLELVTAHAFAGGSQRALLELV